MNKYLVTLICLSSLLACTPKRSEVIEHTTIRTIYMGDPLNTIKGSTNNPKLDRQYFEKLDGTVVTTADIAQFNSVGEYSTDIFSKSSIEQANAAKELGTSNTNKLIRFRVNIENNHLVLKGLGSLENILGFSIPLDSPLSQVENSPFKSLPSQALVKGKSFPMHLLHSSVSPDKNLFSLLLFDNSNDAPALFSFHFIINTEPNIKTLKDSEFVYLLGRGVKANWDKTKPLNIDICGDEIPDLDIINFTRAIKMWSDVLSSNYATEPKLKINVKQTKDFVPFMDFNQHCIQFINDYYYTPDPRISGLGSTLTIVNIHTGHIVDSDIFIYNKEFLKGDLEDTQFLKQYRKTSFLHEFGHLLGLHHKFTNGAVPSVMSYERDKQFVLEPYDIRAILTLYE